MQNTIRININAIPLFEKILQNIKALMPLKFFKIISSHGIPTFSFQSFDASASLCIANTIDEMWKYQTEAIYLFRFGN